MNEPNERDAVATFRRFGNELIAMGRSLPIGKKLVALGNAMKRIPERDFAGDLRALRKPIADLRDAVSVVGDIERAMRELANTLEATIGVDN